MSFKAAGSSASAKKPPPPLVEAHGTFAGVAGAGTGAGAGADEAGEGARAGAGVGAGADEADAEAALEKATISPSSSPVPLLRAFRVGARRFLRVALAGRRGRVDPAPSESTASPAASPPSAAAVVAAAANDPSLLSDASGPMPDTIFFLMFKSSWKEGCALFCRRG